MEGRELFQARRRLYRSLAAKAAVEAARKEETVARRVGPQNV